VIYVAVAEDPGDFQSGGIYSPTWYDVLGLGADADAFVIGDVLSTLFGVFVRPSGNHCCPVSYIFGSSSMSIESISISILYMKKIYNMQSVIS
jgi:hypothetical protein